MLRYLIPLSLFVALALSGCTAPNAQPTLPDPDPAAAKITVSHASAALGDSFTVTLQLHDAEGNPLRQAGHEITFVASSGDLTPAGASGGSESTETVETDDEGRASVSLTATYAGTITVRAYFGATATGAPVGTVHVTVAPATVEVDDSTVTYDGTPKSVTPRYYPPEASVGATITYALDGLALDGPPSAAGVYQVTVTPGEGYEGAATAALVITPRDLVVTGVTWSSKQYDATTVATALSATLDVSNVVDGDDVGLSPSREGVFASAGVGTRAVEGRFELVGEQASNYRINPQPTGSAAITAAELSVAGVTVAAKEYDGTTRATLVGGFSEDAVHGEDVSLAGTFASPNAGGDISVTVELTGADAGNYALSATALTGDITPRPLVLRPAPITLTYGEALPEPVTFLAEGLVDGEGIASVSLAVVGAAAPYAVGSHALQVINPVAVVGTVLSNYDVSTPAVPGALSVVEALVTVTPTGEFTKTYGAADPAFTYDVDGADLAGALTLTRESGEDVGTYELLLGDTSAWSQYRFVLADAAPFSITPATAIVEPAAGQAKTYGDTDPEFDFSITGLQFSDAPAGVLGRESGEAVGGYAFDISGVTVSAGASNYSFELVADAATFQIQPATLTITPDAGQAKLLGAPDPVFTFSATGLANGDTSAVLGGALSRAAGEEAGVYAFNLGSLSAGANYVLTLTGDVTFAVSGVSIENNTVTYDGEAHALVAEFAPAGAEVGATVTYVDAAGRTLSGAPTSVGTYTVTASTGPGYTGSASATLVIEPRELRVTDVEFADKEYDAATGATLSATLLTSNIVPGDDVRLVERLVGTFASSQVGEHDVVGNLELSGADAGNYVIAPQPEGRARITPRSVTLQDAAAADKMYDGDDVAAVTGTLSGVRASDAIGFEAAFAQTNAGSDIAVMVELTGPAATNYGLVDPALTATITQREITVTIAEPDPKTYGDALTLGAITSGFTTTNLVTGETITELTLASDGEDAEAPFGAYAVTPSNPSGAGFTPSNYHITYAISALRVERREVTLTGATTTWTYGNEPEAGDLTPVVADGSLPEFASLGGALDRTDINVGNGATFAPGTLDIVDAASESILDNFTITYSAYEITPRYATITVRYGLTKTYGDFIELAEVNGNYFTASGLAIDESITQVVLSSDGFVASAPVAEYDITASNPSGDNFTPANYNLTFEPGTLEVVARELTLSGSFSVVERPYDGTNVAVVASPHGLVLENLAEGDDVEIDPVAVFVDGAAVGADKQVILTSDSTLTGAHAGNYTLSLTDAPVSTGAVIKATVEFDVTIAGTDGSKTVVYDGGTTFQPNVTSSVVPVPANQPVAFIVDISYGGVSKTSFRDVGTYTVTVTADDPRYEGVSVHDDLEVLAREIIIAGANDTKHYGEENPHLGPSIADSSALGLGANDDFAADSQLAYAGSDDRYLGVGTYDLELGNVTIRRSGVDVTRNYAITFAQQFTIDPLPLIITPDEGQAKIYGDPDPDAFAYRAPGFVGSDDDTLLSGALGREPGESAGSYPYLLGSLDAGANYVLALDAAASQFEITKRALTLTAMTTTMTYGDAGHDLTALVVGGDEFALRPGDRLSGSLAMPRVVAGTAEFVAAEDFAILRDEDVVTDNYDLTYATYEVEARPATITPDAEQSKTYGDDDPEEFTYTHDLLDGDTLTGALARVAGEDVGTYAFTLGTLDNPNYSLSLPEEAATFAITQRQVALGANVDNKEYGDADPDLSPVLLEETTLRAGDEFTGALSYAGEAASGTPYDLNRGTVKVMRGDVDATDNYIFAFGTFTINRKPVSFDITNSDFVIGADADKVHVFRGDGTSEIRGLEVTSTPVSVESFRFTYRRTHDQNHDPVPSGQQTVQNINLLGSYVVTVTATNPNYVGESALSVWVTDANQVVFTDATAHEAVLGATAPMTLELRNAAGEPRPAGPAGLPIALTADGLGGLTFRDANNSQHITSLRMAAGESSATALIRPEVAGTVTVSAVPETTPETGFAAATTNFEAIEPTLTARDDGPYDVVAGGTLQIPIADLLANDDWTGTSTWGFDGVQSATGVAATVDGGNVVVSAATGTGNSTGAVVYQIQSTGEFGKAASATISINVTLPPVEALLFTVRNEIDDFMSQSYEVPSFATVFQSWPRFENNAYHTVPNGPGGNWSGNLSHWSYNSAEERIEYGVNNESQIGIVSEGAFDYFEFEATLQSTNFDDDSIGLVIAFERIGGVNKALIAHRTQGGNDPRNGWGISYLDGSTLTVLTSVSVGGTTNSWSGKSSRVRIDRTGDIIRASATPWNSLSDFRGEMLIDLDANTINGISVARDLSVFKGKKQYGYYVRSQANTTYVNIAFVGGVARDTAILLTDEIDGRWGGSEVYRFEAETQWTRVANATIQTALDYPRTVTSVAEYPSVNGKSYRIYENHVEPITARE